METWNENQLRNANAQNANVNVAQSVKNVFGKLFTKKVPSLVREVLTQIQKRLPLTSDNLLIMESKLEKLNQ